MSKERLPQFGTLFKDGTELLGRQLEDDLEGLGLSALAAFDEALPDFGVLPHLGKKQEFKNAAEHLESFPHSSIR